MKPAKITDDTRTKAQRKADDFIAAAAESADWTGFEQEELRDEQLVIEMLERSKKSGDRPEKIK